MGECVPATDTRDWLWWALAGRLHTHTGRASAHSATGSSSSARRLSFGAAGHCSGLAGHSFAWQASELASELATKLASEPKGGLPVALAGR